MRELEDALGRRASLAEDRNVVATSRPAKDAAVDQPEVVARWWDRAQ